MDRKNECYKQKKYSAELKAEAVEFVRMSSGSASVVARDLGLSPTMLNRWYRGLSVRERASSKAVVCQVIKIWSA